MPSLLKNLTFKKMTQIAEIWRGLKWYSAVPQDMLGLAGFVWLSSGCVFVEGLTWNLDGLEGWTPRDMEIGG